MRPLLSVVLLAFISAVASAEQKPPGSPSESREGQNRPNFRIHAVDAETGRGIPLVELTTVNDILYVTDSAGLAAVYEPGLMGKQVFFQVRSHGYEFRKDGFGYRGFRVVLEPGGSKEIRLQRVNVAERLYRVTGQGIYHDSVLLGEKSPIRRPLLNGGVLGQDSVVNAVYQDKLYWFWGDTNQAGYPLGNFETSGAVSDLPESGGLDPSVGVNLRYFVDEKGFSRAMCPIEGPGPVWIDGLMVVDDDGRDVLVCHYSRMESLGKRLEHGIAVWNDQQDVFEKRVEFPLDAPLSPSGRPGQATIDGRRYYYFPNPYPVVRVRARLQDILDPSRYEAFTPLKPGLHEAAGPGSLQRDDNGNLVWAWKADTATIPHQNPLSQDKKLPETGLDGTGPESIYHLRDVETGRPIRGHGGSVHFNPYRQKWVMVALERFGRSVLGEVWYSEADTLLGPWVYARRIVTHDKYSFYNVAQHPYFDQNGGRRIYFEGTYTDLFAGAVRKTPRYNYNQIMYRLDLADERLFLPQTVYETITADGDIRYTIRQPSQDASVETQVPFYALPPDRPLPGSVSIVAVRTERGPRSHVRLQVGETGEKLQQTVLFHAMPAGTAQDNRKGSPLVALYDFRNRRTGEIRYVPEDQAAPGPQWVRSAKPLCQVWPSPRIDPPRETKLAPRQPER